ncbi:MAG TPA: hypothetical protein DCS97_10450, partial [Planctomycetes bacterium]|nr:hypothetical protein [Planctomycetota bacterium]
FGRGRFRLDAPIRIPAQVERLDFAFADLEAGPALHQRRDRGVLLVGDGPRPLLIERLFTMTGFHGPFRLIEHDGVRDLVLRDLHTQYCALYANTIPGSRVFIDNCACTCEGHEDLPGFRFRGQRVWARQLNPERAHEQVVNDGGDLWVLGFKTENPSTAFLTRGGGRSEILGGIFNQVRQYHAGGATRPTVLNEDSSVSVSASTTDWKANRSFEGPAHVLVREICGGQRRDLVWEVLPLRQQHLVTLPLYAGRS